MKDAQDAVKEIREWPKLTQDYLVEHNDGSIGFVNEMPPVMVCSREEFMESKSGKPSWDKAPEWAQYLAQDADGQWCWYESKPKIHKDDTQWDYNHSGRYDGDCFGTVIGDWRDTLERRPEAEPAVNTDGDQILNYYMPLPGEECECWDGDKWHLGVSVGPYMNGWLCMLPTIGRPFIGSNGDFRPLKSDCERWVEEARKHVRAHMWANNEVIEALYDALKSGELPMPEKD